MPEYQRRVIAEQKDLEASLDRLVAFVSSATFPVLSRVEKRLLLRQQAYMGLYLSVLTERIEAFA